MYCESFSPCGHVAIAVSAPPMPLRSDCFTLLRKVSSVCQCVLYCAWGLSESHRGLFCSCKTDRHGWKCLEMNTSEEQPLNHDWPDLEYKYYSISLAPWVGWICVLVCLPAFSHVIKLQLFSAVAGLVTYFVQAAFPSPLMWFLHFPSKLHSHSCLLACFWGEPQTIHDRTGSDA